MTFLVNFLIQNPKSGGHPPIDNPILYRNILIPLVKWNYYEALEYINNKFRWLVDVIDTDKNIQLAILTTKVIIVYKEEINILKFPETILRDVKL